MKKIKALRILIIFALVMLLSTTVLGINAVKSEASSKEMGQAYYEDSYGKYLHDNGYTGKMASNEVKVDVFSYKISQEMKVSNDKDGVLTGENGTIKWSFDVKESGFYNISVNYIPVKGTTSKIERKLYIDDKTCFKGMNQIVFNRMWDNNDGKPMAEKNGNEIRPVAVEKPEWTTVYIDDSQKRNLEPYKFYLSAGNHTLSFESIKEPFKIGSITFKTAPEIKPYADVIKEWKQKYKIYNGINLLYQAERIDKNTTDIIKSSQDIIVSTDYTSPNTVPYHPYKIRLNTIGGGNWKLPGDFITWNINVPKEGLYRLSFRGRQSTNRGVKSYRQLKINGEVPFDEAMEIGFKYNTKFANYIPGNENGNFLFHFKKGSNTISLETVLGDFNMPLTEVEKSLYVLNDLYLKTIQITGLVPDTHIDYDITDKIPGYAEAFKSESQRLKKVVDELVRITGEKGEKTLMIEKMELQAKELSLKPDNVINELGTLKNNISGLGTWITSISEMPLELDSYTLSAPGAKLISPEPNILVRLYYGTVRFLSTFFVDETKISDSSNKKSITVWISAGRDQAQILKNQIDQSFTPKTDITVKLQLIPIDVILPATLAGNGPDVALNVPQATVMNFAMRNAVTDLSKLDGFGEMKNRYYPSAISPVSYQNGIFGLPEQQTFMMMFYREDILKKLGLKPPKTWDEVDHVKSVLNCNNYDFYIPGVSAYPTFVYQYGGNLYKGTGSNYGIESGLTEDNAMAAFNKFTKYFADDKVPVLADFSNRFRTGQMPIGIAPYTTYNQLEVFAPEIKGMWNFAPVPGVMEADGKINNTVVADTIDCIMMKAAKNKDAAWKFMKWWLDTDTQTQYANSLESIMGSAARYPTANIEVMKQLPWSPKQLNQITEQLKNTVGVPEVPGGYMTTRAIDYAFRAVVTSGENSREALFLNTKQINKELTKKRKEFHLTFKDIK